MSTSSALRLTLSDYNRMIAEDAFRPLGKRRIELIYGELREVTPPGPTHAEAVDRLIRWTTNNTTDREVRLRVQNPIEISQFDSAPEPDIVWAKPKNYSNRHPQPRDILLLVEVADSSLNEDLGEMMELYAKAGIKDYWVINIPDFAIEVFRRPKRDRYLEHQTYLAGQEVSPLAFPRILLSNGGLFSGTL
jgi:Uma2 family endonuclease